MFPSQAFYTYLFTIFWALACLPFSISSLEAVDQHIYRGTAVPREVEAMYRKGLSYLQQEQKGNGSFQGQYGEQPAVSGLALLAFLAVGDDPNYGPYAQNIQSCIDYVLSRQRKSDGYIGDSMYNHGFCTIALAEAYGVCQDSRIGPALHRATKLLLSSQKKNPTKSWRYSPSSKDSDTSIAGACFVAIVAARNAGFSVPDQAVEDALGYYEKCLTPNGSISYVKGSGYGSTATTAIGMAAFGYAKKRNHPLVHKTLTYIKKNPRDKRMGDGLYTEYYLAQALFQAHPQEWEIWNAKHALQLGKQQQENGSWSDNNHSSSNGSSLNTAYALLSLALNYRYLPMYER